MRQVPRRQAKSNAYKKAATKAPKPTMLPAATLMLEAPAVEEELAPEPVGEPETEPDPRVVEAVLLASAPEAEAVEALRMTVVLLLALTVIMAVPLPEATGMTVMPVPTAGMTTAVPTLVSTAGWVGMAVSAAGWVGVAVSAAGWPVTTPSELVAVRNDVWGKASMEEVTAAAEETDWGAC
jgi:hypothetical protein